MANNRMSLKCTVCNDSTIITKHMGSGWCPARAVALDRFLEDHFWCGNKDGMSCGSHFQLEYEQK